MPTNDSETLRENLDTPISSTPLSQRTLLILMDAWPDEANASEWIYSIRVMLALAIETVSSHEFARRHPKGADHPARPKSPGVQGMLDAGWRYNFTTTERYPVFQCPETDEYFNLQEYISVVRDVDVHRLVACTWPAEEDEVRIAPIIEAMKPKALKKGINRKRWSEDVAKGDPLPAVSAKPRVHAPAE